jgi:hypothetical protein
LVGLCFALCIAFLQLATDGFEYQRLSITEKNARNVPHFHLYGFSEESAISQIEDDRKAVRIRMVSHGALIVIILWCLNDGVRISAIPLPARHKKAMNGSCEKIGPVD